MKVNNYQGIKFSGKDNHGVNDNLTVEEALQISINGKPFTITMRTPGNDKELIRGLLFSEDIYRSNDDYELSLNQDNDKGITEANLNVNPENLREGYSNSRSFLSASSCGICGKTELDNLDISCQIEDESKLNIKLLESMFSGMKSNQETFELSGGSHASSAFSLSGELLCTMEDIGRHNAVDKVIGHLINHNLLDQAKCITVSGRISYEIVSKVFAAKIPILAAVSAPSSLAVDFAKELGITLLAFCRDDKATCYAHPERLVSLS
jgi:FdhD protein